MLILPKILGDPISAVENSFDCFTYENSRTIPIVYLRFIYSFLIQVIFAVEIIWIYFLLKYYNNLPFRKPICFLVSGIVFLFFNIQPSMISSLIAIISCRQIGNKSYIMADITNECYDDVH